MTPAHARIYLAEVNIPGGSKFTHVAIQGEKILNSCGLLHSWPTNNEFESGWHRVNECEVAKNWVQLTGPLDD